MFFEVFVVLILIALNGFFAMSELAIVSASKHLLKQKAKNGSRSAVVAIELIEDSGLFLSTVQVGITLIGIIAGAYGGATIAENLESHFMYFGDYAGEVSFVIVVSIITYFSVVIGELIPKQLALNNPEAFALIAARPMKLVSIIFKPVVKIFDISGSVLIKILGINNTEAKITEDEIRAIVEEGAEHGVIEAVERDMFNRIIRLSDRDLKSVMTPRKNITFIDINDSIEQIKEKIHKFSHSRYPVIDGDEEHVVGILLAKRLLDGLLSGQELDIKKFIKQPKFLPENTNCMDAINIFKTKRIHTIIVVDEYGTTEGLVTPSDLLEAMLGALPTNYDSKEDEMIIIREDGSYLIDGLTPLDEIYLNLGIEEINNNIKNFDTISGFLISKFDYDASEGKSIEVADYKFEIVDMDRGVIDKVLVSKITE